MLPFWDNWDNCLFYICFVDEGFQIVLAHEFLEMLMIAGLCTLKLHFLLHRALSLLGKRSTPELAVHFEQGFAVFPSLALNRCVAALASQAAGITVCTWVSLVLQEKARWPF